MRGRDGEGMWKLFEKSFHTFKNFSGKRFCARMTL